MKVNVYNTGHPSELPGANVCELEWLDGRKVQISTSEEHGLVLLRVWPKGGVEVHGNMTDLSMSFAINDRGIEIRNMTMKISYHDHPHQDIRS